MSASITPEQAIEDLENPHHYFNHESVRNIVACIKQLQSENERLMTTLEAYHKAASPVTDNPVEDAFYEKAESSVPKT